MINRSELKNILQTAYNRDHWISTLQFLTGMRDYLTVHLSHREIEVKTQEADYLVKSFNQIASVKTSDGVTLPIFEIILEDKIKIEYNRVGVNEFIKKHIIKDAVKGALVTFSYDNKNEKTEWRFSFISKNSASDFFVEAEVQETNPKKYTYIFGNKEEHRTAIERLYNLEQSRFRLEDFFEAFNVEPVSKKFFEEYKHLHLEFSDFIIENPEYQKLFTDLNDNRIKPEKEIRSFIGRLLGRIVFLYFLQKKNWLGASDENYKDGSVTFLSDLFFNDIENQKDFYNKYLCPVFFNALNKSGRINNEFLLENGQTICIPFLNGGLFEEDQEPENHRTIQFPAQQFRMLFEFFNSFNFTVYENSPEEHTVAVDPEMLGHIFENLIDYNKDTGTFYTPKEIVQYMTQESLIEYLNKHIEKDRIDIENLVKNQSYTSFENDELSTIEYLLDNVKICDPAIGSGAFPMGILLEIFNLKSIIAFKLNKVWKPADVKQKIIQNSIYGVDLDEGAVEIARLRFWLSLVVDESTPKALPNLKYKILVGNSLVNQFEGEVVEIDWSSDSTKGGFFLQQTIEEKIDLLRTISERQKQYFYATSSEKKFLEQEIRALKLEILSKELEVMLNSKGVSLKSLNKNSKKQNEVYKKTLIWKKSLLKVNNLKENEESSFIHFDWALDFPEILNPFIVADKQIGFDIVIGNPPYVDIKAMDKEFVKILFENYSTAINRINLYSIFIEKGKSLLNKNGVLSYIIPNSLLVNDSYLKIRKYIVEDLVQIIKLPDAIFEKAIVETIIILISEKSKNQYIDTVYYKNDAKTNLTNIDFVKYSKIDWRQDPLFRFNIFRNSTKSLILAKIDEIETKLSDFAYISLGITPYDSVKGHSKIDIKNRIFHSHEQSTKEFVPLISGKNIKKYSIDLKFDEYLKYGPWLGAARDEKFFKNPKIIVRQILDGSDLSIISAYSEDEIYFTQIGFSIISKPSSDIHLKYILSILNSKTISFYHKYKFLDTEKKVFPKILIANAKKIPILFNENLNIILPQLVDFVMLSKKTKFRISDIIENNHIALFFEELIDAIVFELYFPEEMRDKNIMVIGQIEEILNNFRKIVNFDFLTEDINKNLKLIADLYFEFKESEVQQKMRKFVTVSPDVLKIILQS